MKIFTVWRTLLAISLVAMIFVCSLPKEGIGEQVVSGKQKIIIDTDIGTDIDDAFALGLALRSPEFSILGITTASGDTELRARLVTRLLKETGRTEIPVFAGIPKEDPKVVRFFKERGINFVTQARWAKGGSAAPFGAVDFLLRQIRLHPGEITLITIGPLTNIGAAIDRDPATFRKLKRVIIMGGSVYVGYNNGYTVNHVPAPEYNIALDIPAAQKLFTSGVPLYVMPLDSTQMKMEEIRRAMLFQAGTPLTDALSSLYLEWSLTWTAGTQATPGLSDVMTVAYALNPQLCPATGMRLRVDAKGYTRVESGPPNTEVCLHSNQDQFFNFFMPRILSWP